MKNTVLEITVSTGDEMARIGFFPGVLATLWGEIAIEQAQDTEAARLYWMMRQNLLGMEVSA
jgi:hypothetical protein